MPDSPAFLTDNLRVWDGVRNRRLFPCRIYRGTVNRQGFGDLGVQLAGVLRTESVTPASTGERGKIRIGKLDSLLEGGRACAFRFQSYKTER